MAAPVTTYQILKDTTEHVIIKLTASFDSTTQESNATRIQANTLYGALDSSKANLLSSTSNTGALSYYGLNVNRIWYDCSSTGDVQVFWNATTPQPIFFFNGNGEYDGMGNWVTISNNAKGTAGCKGDIGVVTRGMVANDSYTMILELRKENEYYQRGQLTEPGAFNYGTSGVRP